MGSSSKYKKPSEGERKLRADSAVKGRMAARFNDSRDYLGAVANMDKSAKTKEMNFGAEADLLSKAGFNLGEIPETNRGAAIALASRSKADKEQLGVTEVISSNELGLARQYSAANNNDAMIALERQRMDEANRTREFGIATDILSTAAGYGMAGGFNASKPKSFSKVASTGQPIGVSSFINADDFLTNKYGGFIHLGK